MNRPISTGAGRREGVFGNRGYTLTELVVVMALFIVVVMISTSSFDNLIRGSKQQSRASAGQIEGIVGLEMLRTDLGHAGLGLPWGFSASFSPTYTELTANGSVSPAPTTLSSFNDFTAGQPAKLPRAIVTGATAGDGPNYLAIKSVVLGLNKTAGRWNYVNYSSASNSYIRMSGDTSSDVQAGDRVITLQSSFPVQTTTYNKNLQVSSSGSFFYAVPSGAKPHPTDSAFKPSDPTQTVLVYGISDTDLRMPFNRADYFVNLNQNNTDRPKSCSQGTGVLYKGIVSHTSDAVRAYPLLTCVGDMRVFVTLDMNLDGLPDTLCDATGDNFQASIGGVTVNMVKKVLADDLDDGTHLRNYLKEVAVYILAHEGTRDGSYTYPGTDGPAVGPPGLAKTRTAENMATDFGAGWKNYRWKVFTVDVALKNLQ